MNTSAAAKIISSIVARNDTESMEGYIMPKHFSARFVVLSFFVGYLGSLTTLELLMRRTSMRGLYNWGLLIGASISMGGIAIWSMHSIVNYSIVLGDGPRRSDLQIVYSPGFTASSFFLPIAVVFLAFCAVGYDDIVSFPRIIIGGILTGFGICGMHYVGQAGISNYTCEYELRFVILSVVIACFYSIVALGMFFKPRSASWWKRGIAAAILATGVSGMHWVASVTTEYRLKMAKPSSHVLSPNITVIAVIIFSIFGCIALLALSLFAQARRAGAAKQAKQVVLASAIFDKEGRLLVYPEGFLPTRKITDAYLERSVNDVFGVSHPSFHWIYRTSCNWAGVADLIPKMRIHLRRAGLTINRVGSPGSNVGDKLLKDTGSPVDDYLLIFRELFCVAAADLAADLKQPVDSLGMLYEDIVMTGLKDKKNWRIKRTNTESEDVERQGFNPTDLGKGKLLFLVKMVGRREAEQLQAAGFRFGAVEKVVPIIATSLRMGLNDLTSRLEMMCDYADGYKILDPGVYIALFTTRASMASGFDILVRKDAKNQLPTVQLPYDSLASWQIDYLKQMENFKVSACIKYLHKATMPSNPSAKERKFANTLEYTLEGLMDQINDMFFNDAVLITDPIEAPCCEHKEGFPPSTAQLITFRMLVPIHVRAPGQKLMFTPMSFFKAQQHVYQNSPDHARFAAKTHREFAPIIDIVESTRRLRKDGQGDEEMEELTELEPISRSTIMFAPLEEEPEPKTFVDELFQICIRTKEGTRF